MPDRILEYYDRYTTIPVEERELISKLVTYKKLKKKEVLYNPGETHIASGYVDKGCLRTFITDEDGNEHITYFAFEDWWVGETFSVMNNLPSNNTVQALEDSELVILTKEAFDIIAVKCPVFIKITNLITAKGYAHILQDEQNKRIKSPDRLYLDLMEKRPFIFNRVPLKHIASYLGIKPESLSRIRKRISFA